MSKLIHFFVCFVIIELLLAIVFQIAAKVYYKEIGWSFKSIFKGMVERTFLMISLVNQYPHAITFFGAVKLATRLNHKEDQKNQDKFNDYYLIGNLISVTEGMGYTYLWGKL